MSNETTPAIENAAEAIRASVIDTPTTKASLVMARAAFATLAVEEIARVDAEATRCSWSIPRDGHPYNEACLYKRDRIDGQVSHGACWDEPYARAAALRTALLGSTP